MSIWDSIQGLFSGSQNVAGTTTSNGQSGGQTSGVGQTASVNTADPRYGQQIGNFFNQLPGLVDPARSMITQGGAATTAADISALRDPTAAYQFAQAKAMLDPSNQDAISQLRGGQSANPYASSNSGAEARLRGQQSAVLGNLAGTLTQQAWAPAAGIAQANQQRELSAGQGLGQLALGQGQTTAGLVGAGGQTNTGNVNTNQTGTSSGWTANQGTSNQTTTNTPSLGSTLGTVAGIGADILPFLAFSDERMKENIKEVGRTHDGQPIHKFNYKGEPATQIGLLAQEVEQTHPHAVHRLGHIDGLKMVDYDAATKGAERKADGGGVDGFHGKVREAFHTFHKLRKEAEHGHKRQGFEFGGGPTSDTWNDPLPGETDSRSVGDPNGWGATVDRTPDAPGMSMTDRARGILGAFSRMGMQSSAGTGTATAKPTNPDPRNPVVDSSNPSLAALSGIMGSVGDTLRPRAADGGRQGFADGGGEDSWLGNLARSLTPNSPFAPADSPTSNILRNEYGVDPRAMYSPSRNLVRDLVSIDPMVPGHSGPLTGIGARMDAENAAAFKGADTLEKRAQIMGKTATGELTPMGRKVGPEIAHMNAATELAKAQTTSAGFDAQLALKGAEAAQAQYLKRAQDLFYLRMVKDNPSNPNREADMASLNEQEAANEKLGAQLRTQMLQPKPGSEAARSAGAATSGAAASAAPAGGGMKTVRGPGGMTMQFPADTSDAEIDRAMRAEWARRNPPAPTMTLPGGVIQQ